MRPGGSRPGAGDRRRWLSGHGPDQAARAARAGGPEPEPAVLPSSARAGGRTSPGRHRRPAGRQPRRRGLPDHLPHRGQGGHLGPGPGVRADQRPGHSQRDRGLPGCTASRRIIYSSSPSVVFNGLDMEGVDESVPYSARFEAAYPETKARAEQIILGSNTAEPGHDLDSPPPDLGPGRQQSAAADPRPGPARTAPAHRPARPADRSDLYRQRRRGPPAGRRSARARLAHRGPDLLRHPGRNDPALGHDQPLPQGRRPGSGQAVGLAPAGVRRRRAPGIGLRAVTAQGKNPR